ncbi:MAG: hypothetical protein ABIB97_00050 [Patescibacteria group bacterium]
MRREIRRTRSFGSSSRRRHNDYDRDIDREDDNRQDVPKEQDNDKPSKATKKKSPWGIIIIIVIIGVVIYFATKGGSETTNTTKQAGPEAIVKAVITALGDNSKATAMNYVASGDTAVNNQVDTLFNNYSGYFIYDDDYIDFTTTTTVVSQSDTEAVIAVTGSADVVEVTYDVYDDEWGDEVEDKVEAVTDEFSFSDIRFSLKKSGEEWNLSEVPSKIF